MKNGFTSLVLALALLVAQPGDALAQTLNEAAAQAARQYNAKVLSARTEQKGNQRVYVIKLLTRDGVVKTVRVTPRGQ